MEEYENAWTIDIWSLGCVILEIISGIPLWMSLKTVVLNKSNTEVLEYGLFAVKGRYAAIDKGVRKHYLAAIEGGDQLGLLSGQ